MIHRPLQWLLQIVAYAAFVVFIGYFAAAPTYQHFEPDSAMLKLAFGHAARHVGECVKLTPEELAELPPNMRRPNRCPRERHPVYVEIVIDGSESHSTSHAATGIWSDGPAKIYESFVVAAGSHEVTVRMRDSGRVEGFDFEAQAVIDLAPLEHRVIDFNTRDGFSFGIRED